MPSRFQVPIPKSKPIFETLKTGAVELRIRGRENFADPSPAGLRAVAGHAVAAPAARAPPSGDAVAINAVLLAAVQHLALTGEARPGSGGVALDAAGRARIGGALDALRAAFPD